MKKFIRKVAALGAGSAMLVGTLGGALAAGETLADLPEPFIAGGVYADVAMVVGADAGSNDDAARTTVKGYFDDFATGEGVGAITSSSDTEKLYFGENLTQEFSASLDDGDLDGLWDDGIDFRGESIETHEEIVIPAYTAEVDTVYVATSGLTGEEELSLTPALYTTGANTSWGYRYVFDETIEDNITTDHEFKIDFLGMEIRISDTTASTNTVVITTGTQASMKQDTTVDSGNGHTIHIGTIFETKVEVWVDDLSPKFLDEGDEETFTIGSDQIEVKVDDIGYTDDVESRTALVTYGEDISTTVKDGDPVQTELGMPDVDDKSSNAVWGWDIFVSTDEHFNNTDFIGIEYNQKVSKHDDDPLPVLGGEFYATPYNYITLDFEIPEQAYQEYAFEFDDSYTIDNATSTIDEAVLLITAVGRSGENDGLDMAGTDTDMVAVNASGHVWVMDNDGDWQGRGIANSTTIGTGLSIEPSSDSTKYITFYNTSGDVVDGTANTIAYVDIEDVESGDENAYTGTYLRANMTIASAKLGATQGTAEAGDLYYYRVVTPGLATAALTEIQSWDDGALMTMYGMKVTGSSGDEDIKSAVENDEIYLWVPEDEAYGEITFNIRTTGSAVEPVLTSESGASAYDNVILVGGPCVNSLTAEYMGLTYPACESASTIPENQAIIKLVEMNGKSALIVAGWEQADTQRAASKLSEGGLDATDSIIVE
jgi:hypothetical protein